MRLVYLDSARDDLIDILRYIAVQGDAAIAQAFVARLQAYIRHLADLKGMLGTARPELGDHIRSTPHRGYVVFFRYHAGTFEVVNILHGSRDIAEHPWPDPD